MVLVSQEEDSMIFSVYCIVYFMWKKSWFIQNFLEEFHKYLRPIYIHNGYLPTSIGRT